MSEIPFAPWCRPKSRTIIDSSGLIVTETTVYGYHALAALLYLGWCGLRQMGEK